jgi:hypothetical protein
MHHGTHLGHIRSGAIDKNDHHGHRSPFWVKVYLSRRGVERNGEKGYVVQGPGAELMGGPATGLASSIASSLVDKGQPASGLSGSNSCSPSPCVRDALPLSFLASFTRTTLRLGVSLGGCLVVPEHYLRVHLSPARVPSRHTRSR